MMDQRSTEARRYRALYASTAWQALRRAQLNEQPLCERCRADGLLTEATIVHHVEAHKGERAKFFDPGNLQSLCKPCHDGPVQSLERGGNGFGRPRFDQNGRVIW